MLNVIKTLKRDRLNASPVSNGSTMFEPERLRGSIKFLIIYDNLSTDIMFFCCVCRPKIRLALKFLNEIEEKQKSMDERVKQLEEELKFLNT